MMRSYRLGLDSEVLSHVSTVIALPVIWTLLPFPALMYCDDPLNAAPPSITLAVAVAFEIVPLFALLVESAAESVVPFGKCQTPAKLESQTAVLFEESVETAPLP